MKTPKTMPTLDLGTFDGYNLEHDKAIINLSAADLIYYDHDLKGETEFWPAGDCWGVALIFKGLNNGGHCAWNEVLCLQRLLQDMGGDTITNYALIYHALHFNGEKLHGYTFLTADKILDCNLTVIIGENNETIQELESRAAYDILETYHPDIFKMLNNPIDGLSFDASRFLHSGTFGISQIKLENQHILIIETH